MMAFLIKDCVLMSGDRLMSGCGGESKASGSSDDLGAD